MTNEIIGAGNQGAAGSFLPETDITKESRGGLVVCGMNWGDSLGNGKIVHEETRARDWSVPYFSHPSNRSKYRNTVMSWFRAWGHPLYPETPTELDGAIIQANLFYESIPSGKSLVRTECRWITAFDRLLQGVANLDASGLLLISTAHGNWMEQLSLAGKLSEWDTFLKGSLKWTTPTCGRLTLRFCTAPDFLMANCVHSRRQPGSQVVESARTAMQPWLDQVLSRYRAKQKSLRSR